MDNSENLDIENMCLTRAFPAVFSVIVEYNHAVISSMVISWCSVNLCYLIIYYTIYCGKETPCNIYFVIYCFDIIDTGS